MQDIVKCQKNPTNQTGLVVIINILVAMMMVVVMMIIMMVIVVAAAAVMIVGSISIGRSRFSIADGGRFFLFTRTRSAFVGGILFFIRMTIIVITVIDFIFTSLEHFTAMTGDAAIGIVAVSIIDAETREY
jgi:hypothetical protein